MLLRMTPQLRHLRALRAAFKTSFGKRLLDSRDDMWPGFSSPPLSFPQVERRWAAVALKDNLPAKRACLQKKTRALDGQSFVFKLNVELNIKSMQSLYFRARVFFILRCLSCVLNPVAGQRLGWPAGPGSILTGSSLGVRTAT